MRILRRLVNFFALPRRFDATALHDEITTELQDTSPAGRAFRKEKMGKICNIWRERKLQQERSAA